MPKLTKEFDLNIETLSTKYPPSLFLPILTRLYLCFGLNCLGSIVMKYVRIFYV